MKAQKTPKTPKIPKGVDAENILELLALVAQKRFPYRLLGPIGEIESEDTVRGKITSSITKRLNNVSIWADNAAEIIEQEHLKLHEQEDALITDHDCHTAISRIEAANKRSNLLRNLFWLSVRSECPQEAANAHVCIRKDWTIISPADHIWEDIDLFPEASDPANSVVVRLIGAMRGQEIRGAGANDDPEENQGTEIATIYDPCIRSIHALMTEAKTRMIEASLINGKDEKTLSKAEADAWLEANSAGALKRRNLRVKSLELTARILYGLFWQSVRDNVPGISRTDGLTLRSGWKVYKKEAKQDPFISLRSSLFKSAFSLILSKA